MRKEKGLYENLRALQNMFSRIGEQRRDTRREEIKLVINEIKI